MTTVLFLGKSDRRIETWARAHAAVLAAEGGRVIFLAPYGENHVDDNFEFVNCLTVRNPRSIADIQRAVPVSLNRAIACDRSLADYSSATSYGNYSRYSLEQIEGLVASVGTALLEHMGSVDYCIDGLYDNFVTPLAFEIAATREVPFYLIRWWHFWHDRFHLVEGRGYTSALVDDLYRRYRRRVNGTMLSRVRAELNAARFSTQPFEGEGFKLRMRIVFDKFRSYERPALRNFLRRRLARVFGSLTSRGLRFVNAAHRPERYVVFALHIMPEASILGTDPEIADQFSLIRRMSLSVPAGMQILCKAHPGDRFGRDLDAGFVRRLCSLANVSLVPESEKISSFLEDPRCLAVATINGSVAVESVLAGKPCFLFGKGIFAIADCFLKPRDDFEFFQQLMAIESGAYQIDRSAVVAIILALKRGSIASGRSLKQPGTWLDYYVSLLPAIHAFHRRMILRQSR